MGHDEPIVKEFKRERNDAIEHSHECVVALDPGKEENACVGEKSDEEIDPAPLFSIDVFHPTEPCDAGEQSAKGHINMADVHVNPFKERGPGRAHQEHHG